MIQRCSGALKIHLLNAYEIWACSPFPNMRYKKIWKEHWCHTNKRMGGSSFPWYDNDKESESNRAISWLFMTLRVLARYDAKIAKICNFWTFWPVIQLINHLFKIRKKPSLPFFWIFKRWHINISWISGKNLQKLQIFAVFAPYLASILNLYTAKNHQMCYSCDCGVVMSMMWSIWFRQAWELISTYHRCLLEIEGSTDSSQHEDYAWNNVHSYSKKSGVINLIKDRPKFHLTYSIFCIWYFQIILNCSILVPICVCSVA